MRKLHLGLVQQLGQLEARQCQIADAIAEVNRRTALLDEVMSWNTPQAENGQELSQEQPAQEVVFQEEVAEELPSEEIFLAELPLEVAFQEELPQEVVFQEEVAEELPSEEIFLAELPQEEMFQEELAPEESSEEEHQEEEAVQADEFRNLDTEGTEIQWVNR